MSEVEEIWEVTRAGDRLDYWLAEALSSSGVSRERVKAWVRSGQVRVAGEACLRPERRLVVGELVTVATSCLEGWLRSRERVMAEDGVLDVLYQDEALLVLDKPAGLIVHPVPGRTEGTLVHRLVWHYPELADLDSTRPGIVHRLDKDTSGLLVVARSEAVRSALAEAFAARQVRKEYLALVWGVPETASGEIDAPLGRHPTLKTQMAVVARKGRSARTCWRVLWADPAASVSLLAVRLHTGRTHQIRVHLQHIGYPIVRDPVYGWPDKEDTSDPMLRRLTQRQMLHAWRLSFRHPIGGEELSFLCPPPRDFERVLLRVTRRLQRVVLTGLSGCGKSSVLGKLAASGVSVLDADAVVAGLYTAGENGWELFRRHFGERFILPGQGDIDRQALMEAMAASPAVRLEVEELIHPLVLYWLEAFWSAQTSRRVAVAEVPLFLEAWGRENREEQPELLVGIYCSKEIRAARLTLGRNLDAGVLDRVDAWQWPEARKLRACQLVLDNTGEESKLELRITALLRVLAWLRRCRVRRLLAGWRRLWVA
ncbi:23S rRNA pseudouridine1911/1915/1917 synthase [Desulfovibrionales bacterium]